MARVIEIKIGCCGECPYYSMKKHKCQRSAADCCSRQERK